MDEFGGNTSESREGRRDKARCACVCECAPPLHHRSTCTVSLLHPSRYGRPLTRSLAPCFFSISRSLPVPFFYWLSCPLVFLSLDSFYDSGPISCLAIGFTLVYCVLTLFAYASAVYFVLIRWSFQILNFGFDSSPGQHILLVNLAIPSPTSRAFVEKKMKIFSHVFLVYYCTSLHFEM